MNADVIAATTILGTVIAAIITLAVWLTLREWKKHQRWEAHKERDRRYWAMIDQEHDLGLHTIPEDDCLDCCFEQGKLGPVRADWQYR